MPANSWIAAMQQAREELGIEGFQPCTKGTALYNRAKELNAEFQANPNLISGGAKRRRKRKGSKSRSRSRSKGRKARKGRKRKSRSRSKSR